MCSSYKLKTVSSSSGNRCLKTATRFYRKSVAMLLRWRALKYIARFCAKYKISQPALSKPMGTSPSSRLSLTGFSPCSGIGNAKKLSGLRICMHSASISSRELMSPPRLLLSARYLNYSPSFYI